VKFGGDLLHRVESVRHLTLIALLPEVLYFLGLCQRVEEGFDYLDFGLPLVEMHAFLVVFSVRFESLKGDLESLSRVEWNRHFCQSHLEVPRLSPLFDCLVLKQCFMVFSHLLSSLIEALQVSCFVAPREEQTLKFKSSGHPQVILSKVAKAREELKLDVLVSSFFEVLHDFTFSFHGERVFSPRSNRLFDFGYD